MALLTKQLSTLVLVCDTFVPSVPREQDQKGFFARKASDLGTAHIVDAILSASPPEAAGAFAAVLDMLESPGLGATWGGPARTFSELGPEDRERVLSAWMHSPIAELRAAFVGLAGLVLSIYYAWSDERGPNPNWEAIGYDGPLSPPPKIERPIRPLAVVDGAVLECDTVVVGSGAGGGVVAGELAEAGQDVIVVEKGPYVAEDGFTQREVEMMLKLYERGAGLRSKNAGITVLAGSCLGGGTTINWTGALRTPDYVLEEWATEHQNPQFLSGEFTKSVEAVERDTHVNTRETHVDRKGQLLSEAARKLGYPVRLYPRNVEGCDPAYCGYCNLGCQKGAKRGTLATYLRRAHERGARILVDTHVARVVVEAGRATGVTAVQLGADGVPRALTIRAKRVVVAAGSIHTPALLLRSGMTHEHLGRHLHIHPGSGLGGRYPEPVRAWSGSMMPVSCDEFTRVDGRYGFKLINAPLHVVAFATFDWLSGVEHKERMLQMAHIASIGPFVRERDTGRIELGPNGEPVVDYWPSAYDMKHLILGLQESLKLHYEAGAEIVYLPGGRRFHSSQGRRKLDELLAEMPGWPWEPNRFLLMTAHQMGTCRMGGDASRHPLTPEGRLREVPNLFVADASTFPSCSGANPMPSVQHIAHYVAQHIKAEA